MEPEVACAAGRGERGGRRRCAVLPHGRKALQASMPAAGGRQQHRGTPQTQLCRCTFGSQHPLPPALLPPLQRELAEALPAGVLHTQHRFVRYAEAAGGVTAEFNTPQGRRSVEAALLVGCDGSQSAVRQQLLGDGPPKYLGGRRVGSLLLLLPGFACHGGWGRRQGGLIRMQRAWLSTSLRARMLAATPCCPPGMAIWRAVRPQPGDWLVEHGSVSWGGPGQPSLMTSTFGDGQMSWQVGKHAAATTCRAGDAPFMQRGCRHAQPPLPCLAAAHAARDPSHRPAAPLQGFAPWPADQLHVIGGGRRAYISQEADPSEQGGSEARRSAEEVGAERRARALAAFKGHPQFVRGEWRCSAIRVGAACCRSWQPLGARRILAMQRRLPTQPRLVHAAFRLPTQLRPACCAAPADLIASTDPLAITEHGQFYRDWADSQVQCPARF